MGRTTDRQVESVLKDHNTVTLHSFMVNDLHLTGNELIIFATVYSFSKDGQSCFWGSRRYLGSWCQIHEGAVDYQLNKLVRRGLIIKGKAKKDGKTFNTLRANMGLIDSIIAKSQANGGTVSNSCDSKSQIFSTDQSQIFMTNSKEEDNQADIKEDIPFSEIIEHLNETAGTRFRASTPKTQAHIRARWNEGYRLDDFTRVIDVKCAEWLGDAKMAKYLCPDTLFGTKFEKYLNQPMPHQQAQGTVKDSHGRSYTQEQWEEMMSYNV